MQTVVCFVYISFDESGKSKRERWIYSRQTWSRILCLVLARASRIPRIGGESKEGIAPMGCAGLLNLDASTRETAAVRSLGWMICNCSHMGCGVPLKPHTEEGELGTTSSTLQVLCQLYNFNGIQKGIAPMGCGVR